MLKSYWVYMVRCNDSSYYIGVTNDLERRLSEHKTGRDHKSYTSSRLPIALVYSAEFSDVRDAIDWEKHIKRWSRAKKEVLISGEREKLIPLSKRKRVQDKLKKRSAENRH
jgi:putative endonuclease